MRFCFPPTENKNCLLPTQFWQRQADRSSCLGNHTGTVILASTRLILHGRECAVTAPLSGSRSCSEVCGLTGVKGRPYIPLSHSTFFCNKPSAGNTNNMLHFYIMHRRQEFTHSAFAFSDAFRRTVDDFVLEASYLYVLTTICKLR